MTRDKHRIDSDRTMRTEKVARMPIQESAKRDTPRGGSGSPGSKKDTDGQDGIRKEAKIDTKTAMKQEVWMGKKEQTNWH